MAQGTVKFYNEAKGFGFIQPDGGGVDLFVHISRCVDGLENLPEGARVKFETRQSQKQAGKYEATDVMLI
jgi:CspA family cold shock protein